MSEKELRALAVWAYRIRRLSLEGICAAGCGHPGGSLSCAELLAYLYFHEMRLDPANPQKNDRDRLVLSKGHAAPAYYAALALRGYFAKGEMRNLRQLSSMLQGHPDMRKIPGVDMSTGSLGQGLSVANGMSLAARVAGIDYRVYCIMGDGETQEGQVWEAVMTAAHYKLSNVTVFLDQNGLQIDGPVSEVMNNAPYDEKFTAFDWHVIPINGNNLAEIDTAVQEAKREDSRPTAIICRTIKGKGISFMEEQCSWHGAAPSSEQAIAAFAELDAILAELEVAK